MNIFYLHENPIQSAKWHLDKHVVKMPIEYAQLLSTAHRLLDGTMWIDRTANNRRIKRWRLDDDREDNLYKAGHINHPSAVWCRETTANYFHLFSLYTATLAEFTYRYGKQHGASKPWLWLQRPPKNLKRDELTPMPQAMPDYCKIVGDSIGAYRKYYINEKKRFATWRGKINGREIPEWYVSGRSLSA